MDRENRFVKVFRQPSRTKQSFKPQCDVNLIMKRFKKTVGADFLDRYQGYLGGQFGDFSEVQDYRSALHQIAQGRAVFDALPAIVRKRFDNDPALFLDFVQDSKNADELVRMGLANPLPVEKPVEPLVS